LGTYEADKDTQPAKPAKKGKDGRKKDADWAAGLKQLYDNVAEEPIPDHLQSLLSKLDDGSK
jgi:hypothetical protein